MLVKNEMTSKTDYKDSLECSGELCPMPLLKTKLRLNSLESGDVLKVTATDAGSLRDIPAFISLSDNELVHSETHDNSYIFYIQKG